MTNATTNVAPRSSKTIDTVVDVGIPNVLNTSSSIMSFSLAMAFSGNDLVNFIGVPLSGLSSYQDYVANGAGDPKTFMMGSILGLYGS